MKIVNQIIFQFLFCQMASFNKNARLSMITKLANSYYFFVLELARQTPFHQYEKHKQYIDRNIATNKKSNKINITGTNYKAQLDRNGETNCSLVYCSESHPTKSKSDIFIGLDSIKGVVVYDINASDEMTFPMHQ